MSRDHAPAGAYRNGVLALVLAPPSLDTLRLDEAERAALAWVIERNIPLGVAVDTDAKAVVAWCSEHLPAARPYGRSNGGAPLDPRGFAGIVASLGLVPERIVVVAWTGDAARRAEMLGAHVERAGDDPGAHTLAAIVDGLRGPYARGALELRRLLATLMESKLYYD